MGEDKFVKDHFARKVMYEREQDSFITKDESKAIFNMVKLCMYNMNREGTSCVFFRTSNIVFVCFLPPTPSLHNSGLAVTTIYGLDEFYI